MTSSLRVYAINPQNLIAPVVVLVFALSPTAYEIVSVNGIHDYGMFKTVYSLEV